MCCDLMFLIVVHDCSPVNVFFGVFMSTIAERLKAERERLSLSQTSFAEVCGVQKRSQINYEKGERSPDMAYIAALIAADIGVDVLYVITGVRSGNTATTPVEMAYLRNCRALPTAEARLAGLNGLVALRKAYGIDDLPDLLIQSPRTPEETDEIDLLGEILGRSAS